MMILCGDDTCESVRCRDYPTADLAVTVVMHAAEQGFDTNSNDAYELLASEGLLGDPDDLSHYEWMHVLSDILNLAADAIDYLRDNT